MIVAGISLRQGRFAYTRKNRAMSNTNNIVDLLQAGIKVEGLRQKAISSNIANMETPGYRRIDVRFEELLANALGSSSSVDPGEIEPEIYEPQNTIVKSNGNDVNLELEIGEMVKNSLSHTAYVRLLHRKFAQMEEAINVQA
jgi:flagellar basal-body rod protein FlgB